MDDYMIKHESGMFPEPKKITSKVAIRKRKSQIVNAYGEKFIVKTAKAMKCPVRLVNPVI